MSKKLIEHMVNRFLSWKLPEDFAPDGGISFNGVANKGTKHEFVHEPSGTNLFDYNQAYKMVENMIEGLDLGAEHLVKTEEHIHVTLRTKDSEISFEKNLRGF
jgi:hypothetical protein